jgi:hypothetical protein
MHGLDAGHELSTLERDGPTIVVGRSVRTYRNLHNCICILIFYGYLFICVNISGLWSPSLLWWREL